MNQATTATPAAQDVFGWVDDTARRRARAGLTRRLDARRPVATAIDLASNDYLGLLRHPAVVEASVRAARDWGAGASGARLATGTTELHARLESELADLCGAQAALVFSSGYLANLGALAAMGRPNSMIVTDEHNHASIVDGCRLAGAEAVTTPHDDVDALRHVLRHRDRSRVLVVTESVFSVDGDLADLSGIAAACREAGAGLLVDDAHGFGVVGSRGEGAAAEAGLSGQPDVLVTLTLSKAIGAQGGAVLGPRRVIEHIMNEARSFIFDAGLAPAVVGGALGALEVLRQEPDRPARARAVAQGLSRRLAAAGLPVSDAQAAVISVRAPNAPSALEWAQACRRDGVAVGCFRPPSVPDRISRIRLTAHATLTEAELDTAAAVITANSPW